MSYAETAMRWIRTLPNRWPRSRPLYLCTEQFPEDGDPPPETGWIGGPYELREIMPDGTLRRLVALDGEHRPTWRLGLPTEGAMSDDVRSLVKAELIYRTGWYLDSTEIPGSLFKRAWVSLDSATDRRMSDPALPTDLGTIWAAGRSRRRPPVLHHGKS
jgi:hypothetical protein